ncbi:MAG: type II toxin-antitoxin system VapC family toxin [Myxococcota bacterium]
MILIDANVFMYAAGADHPHRKASVDLLDAVAEGSLEAATNAEVLQELLHRYRRLLQWEQVMTLYESVRVIVPEVLPVTARDLDRSRSLLADYPALSTRDAVHAAVVLENDVEALCTWDRDFDVIRELTVITPAEALASR